MSLSPTLSTDLLRPFITCCIGRFSDFALQQADGGYYRANRPLTYEDLWLHVQGVQTIANYVMNEASRVRSAVFDADQDNGLTQLIELQRTLLAHGCVSYLERSRRGGHLYVFLDGFYPAALVRQWLLPFCPPSIEFYPKQDSLSPSVPYGSSIRLPLGIHKRSGLRYPFISLVDDQLVPVATTMQDALSWFATVQKNTVPALPSPTKPATLQAPTHLSIPFKKSSLTAPSAPTQTIREWCLQQDCVSIISKYVELDKKGSGYCPFSAHHANGSDEHPSFLAYYPSGNNVCCWYCRTWGQGGSLFDFLKLYYNLDARSLWARIQQGAQF